MFWLLILGYVVLKLWVTYRQFMRGYNEARLKQVRDAALTVERQKWDEKLRVYRLKLEKVRLELEAEEAKKTQMDSNLWILGLKDYPQTIEELKQARRKAMFKAHPDKGGAPSDAVFVNNAFATLAARFATGGLS